MDSIKCAECSATVPLENGPTHDYMPASAGCWRTYGEILAREYGNRDYWKVHRLTVDAYAAQHASGTDPRQLQSVTVHLLALYLFFEKQMQEDQIRKLMEKIIQKNKGDFRKLNPPSFQNTFNVTDVIRAETASDHESLVTRWALEVWNAWSEEHRYIKKLAEL